MRRRANATGTSASLHWLPARTPRRAALRPVDPRLSTSGSRGRTFFQKPPMRTRAQRIGARLAVGIVLMAFPAAAAGQDGTIRQWQYVAAPDGEGCRLEMVTVPMPQPG